MILWYNVQTLTDGTEIWLGYDNTKPLTTDNVICMKKTVNYEGTEYIGEDAEN